MNGNQALTFHHHWLVYWKYLAMVCLLALLAPIGMVVWLPLGVACLMLAVILAVAVYECWTWHTFTFTEDNRLVRRRGFYGCTRDIISLFGVITPYQIPGLGTALDVGSVHLAIPGPDVQIDHVANFGAFYERLVYSAGQRGRDSPVVQFVFQVPPAP